VKKTFFEMMISVLLLLPQVAATCSERSKDGYSHPFAVFDDHHRQRRRRLVNERLNGVAADVRKRTLYHLKQELADLGIKDL
jgi:hypothetical protein